MSVMLEQLKCLILVKINFLTERSGGPRSRRFCETWDKGQRSRQERKVNSRWSQRMRNVRSAARKRKNTTEITPFIVKKAAFSLERSAAETNECS